MDFFRKSTEKIMKKDEPEEDPEVIAKRKQIEREKDLPPESQTPTVSADHFVDEPAAILALKKMLAYDGKYGFPGTDGSRWANYKQHVLNTHPLVSIFYAHDEHPFDHWERAQYLFCMLSITFMISAVLTNSQKISRDDCDTGLERTPPLSPSEVQQACDTADNWKIVGPIIAAMVTIPTDMVLKAFMVCGWVQGWSIQETCESIGGYCMKIQMCYAVFFLIVGFVMAAQGGDFGGVCVTFLFAQVESWVLFFIKSFVLFNLFFNGAKSSFRKKYPGLVSIETAGLKRSGSTGVDLTLPSPGLLGGGPKVVSHTVQPPASTQQVNLQIPGEQIMVICPEGATPGQQIQFQTPSGALLMAVIPDGVNPGQQFPVLTGPPQAQVPKASPPQGGGLLDMRNFKKK
ncbi:hypothetical protein TrVE_jg13622 [Triparma verrucosa]|uniref:Uncharacterized protein n=1 Tax=Triparma verrucosa TaxID=1606542 RepID=A0A9W7BCN5_9STRA|nr:hypothetical protein TrVE_jg13622 [Triparma verrucosa]